MKTRLTTKKPETEGLRGTIYCPASLGILGLSLTLDCDTKMPWILRNQFSGTFRPDLPDPNVLLPLAEDIFPPHIYNCS